MNLEKVKLDQVPVSSKIEIDLQWNFLLFKAYCARVNVNGVQRTKEDYLRHQIDNVFTSNTFESLLLNAEQLRSKLLQLGCFRDVTVVIDSAKGSFGKLIWFFRCKWIIVLDAKADYSYDVTYITEEFRPISGGINTAVGQNEGSLVRDELSNRCLEDWNGYFSALTSRYRICLVEVKNLVLTIRTVIVEIRKDEYFLRHQHNLIQINSKLIESTKIALICLWNILDFQCLYFELILIILGVHLNKMITE